MWYVGSGFMSTVASLVPPCSIGSVLLYGFTGVRSVAYDSLVFDSKGSCSDNHGLPVSLPVTVYALLLCFIVLRGLCVICVASSFACSYCFLVSSVSLCVLVYYVCVWYLCLLLPSSLLVPVLSRSGIVLEWMSVGGSLSLCLVCLLCACFCSFSMGLVSLARVLSVTVSLFCLIWSSAWLPPVHMLSLFSFGCVCASPLCLVRCWNPLSSPVHYCFLSCFFYSVHVLCIIIIVLCITRT